MPVQITMQQKRDYKLLTLPCVQQQKELIAACKPSMVQSGWNIDCVYYHVLH